MRSQPAARNVRGGGAKRAPPWERSDQGEHSELKLSAESAFPCEARSKLSPNRASGLTEPLLDL